MINRSIDLITQGEQQTALFYNCTFVESLQRSGEITKHFLISKTYVKIFIDYALKDNFVVGSFFEQKLEMLLTVHKSVMAGFLQDNHERFFEEVNLRFLKSRNFLNKLFGLQLLEKMLQDSAVEGKYVNSLENLKIVMNLMREESTNNPFKSMAVGVFKRFLVNQKMPKEIAASRQMIRKKKEEADADAGDEEVIEIISSMDAESIRASLARSTFEIRSAAGMNPLPTAIGAAGSPGKGKGIEEQRFNYTFLPLLLYLDRYLARSSQYLFVPCSISKSIPSKTALPRDREEDFPPKKFYVSAQAGTAIRIGIAITSQVQHWSLTIAKRGKKSYVYKIVVSRGTSLPMCPRFHSAPNILQFYQSQHQKDVLKLMQRRIRLNISDQEPLWHSYKFIHPKFCLCPLHLCLRAFVCSTWKPSWIGTGSHVYDYYKSQHTLR
ncbi:Mo25-like [Dillenia turbinata]|uniref:Mo25-like n=1 Tax=Dillenia turbinata TaxID=194707 RepID=A0AAN8Z2G9_9MAGN